MDRPILWGEFLVNTITDGVQDGVQLQALSNGQFVAAWQQTTINELGFTDSVIYTQRFYSGAVSQGDPVRVNTKAGGINSNLAVTKLADGRLVYTWEHHELNGDATNYSIKARIFNPDGTPSDLNGDVAGGTDEFEVVPSSTAPLSNPLITALSNGGFVVTYNDAAGDGAADAGVKAVIYDSNIQKQSSGSVNVTTTGAQDAYASVGLSGGQFLSIYSENSSVEGAVTLKANICSTGSGTVSPGTEATISTSVKKGTVPVATELSDHNILVVWTEESSDGTGNNVKAQIFHPNMTPLADPFVVSMAANGDQSAAGVTALAQGGFAITYLESDGLNAPQVRLAVFSESYQHLFSEDRVLSSDFDAGKRMPPKIIELYDGRLIAAWDEDVSGRWDDPQGIHGQAIDARFKAVDLQGFSGADQWVGTDFGDILKGEGGDDHLSGRDGNDTLNGGIGSDLLDGGAGADQMIGGAGDDTYRIDNAGDTIIEAAGGGIDTVHAIFNYALGAEIENLIADDLAAVVLTGNGSNNAISGNAANNVIDGGAGADRMEGYAGNDTYYVDNAGDVVVESGSDAADMVYTTISYVLVDNVENLAALGAGAINLTGNALNNAITGNAASNVIDGGVGDDTIAGNGGDDNLNGGLGNDAIAAGDGNDMVNGGDGNDTIAGDGGNDNLNGGLGDDAITAGDGDDIVDGGDGNDNLTGDGGNDNLNGALGDDAIMAGDGNDVINGGFGNDVIAGGNGNDTITSGTGNDRLSGGAGKDVFIFADPADKFGNLDSISDFTVKQDKIELDNLFFKKLGKGTMLKPGKLKKDFFYTGTKAHDKNDYLVYNKKTGVLSYDADGSGKGKAVEIIKFDNKAKLAYTDFLVI